jgi:hypothetical protein
MACESGLIQVAGNKPAHTIKTAAVSVMKTTEHQEPIFIFARYPYIAKSECALL